MPSPVFLRSSDQSELPFLRAVETVRQDLLLLKACLGAMRVRLELKYSDTQPRWPAGDPRGGQWMPLDGGGDASAFSEDSLGEAPDGTPIDGIGGIPEDKLNWTTQQFMSAYCKGYVEVPGEFLNMTIRDVLRLAQTGDAGARQCKKILTQDRFRKGK